MKSVFLYGSECWRETQADVNKLSSFHNGCLRKICKIFWPEIISNTNLYKRTNSLDIVMEIRRRRMRWLGHVLRMPQDNITKIALRWTRKRKETEADKKLPGEEQYWLILRKNILPGERQRRRQRTGLNGEALLRPYVPEGTKRKSK